MHRRAAGVVWTALAGGMLLLVLLTGDWIRSAVDSNLRLALCVVGGSLFTVATLAYILTPRSPFGLSVAAWVKVAGAAALVGLLLFILFIQDVECEVRGSGRGIATVCEDVRS